MSTLVSRTRSEWATHVERFCSLIPLGNLELRGRGVSSFTRRSLQSDLFIFLPAKEFILLAEDVYPEAGVPLRNRYTCQVSVSVYGAILAQRGVVLPFSKGAVLFVYSRVH